MPSHKSEGRDTTDQLKIYTKRNVLEAASARIAWIFDEFENVIVGDSGGKDSTVTFQLALEVAREKGRLPLKVMWLDQEAEWASTVDQVRTHMYHPDVEPLWYQIPFRLFNATSSSEHWLNCWDPAAEDLWIHPRDPVAFTENRYGTDRFADLFTKIVGVDFRDQRTAYLAGVRAEESPRRALGMTEDLTYKWATWGSVRDKLLEHYTFYPIYDWSYTDVWKAILDHGWRYNDIYNSQYRYGLPVREMRVSNVHHETAVGSLFHLQELEPDTYDRLTARIAGIDMAGKMGTADYFVRTLPADFSSWIEYRDYLLHHLVEAPDFGEPNPEWAAAFRHEFDRQDRQIGDEAGDTLYKVQINSILTNDWEGIKTKNWDRSPEIARIKQRRKKEGKWQTERRRKKSPS